MTIRNNKSSIVISLSLNYYKAYSIEKFEFPPVTLFFLLIFISFFNAQNKLYQVIDLGFYKNSHSQLQTKFLMEICIIVV